MGRTSGSEQASQDLSWRSQSTIRTRKPGPYNMSANLKSYYRTHFNTMPGSNTWRWRIWCQPTTSGTTLSCRTSTCPTKKRLIPSSDPETSSQFTVNLSSTRKTYVRAWSKLHTWCGKEFPKNSKNMVMNRNQAKYQKKAMPVGTQATCRLMRAARKWPIINIRTFTRRE